MKRPAASALGSTGETLGGSAMKKPSTSKGGDDDDGAPKFSMMPYKKKGIAAIKEKSTQKQFCQASSLGFTSSMAQCGLPNKSISMTYYRF